MFIANERSFSKKIFALEIPLKAIKATIQQSWGMEEQEGGQGAHQGGEQQIKGALVFLCNAPESADIDAEELKDLVISDPTMVERRKAHRLLQLFLNVKRPGG